jgi:hypothetical protein
MQLVPPRPFGLEFSLERPVRRAARAVTNGASDSQPHPSFDMCVAGWLVGLALVCAFVCAFVSAFVCSFRGLFACVLSWDEI